MILEEFVSFRRGNVDVGMVVTAVAGKGFRGKGREHQAMAGQSFLGVQMLDGCHRIVRAGIALHRNKWAATQGAKRPEALSVK